MHAWGVQLAWVLLLAAAALLVWGVVWGDRARGRRRCPGCWYPAPHKRRWRCPECGRVTAERADFLKTRRRWWVVAPVLMLLACSYAVRVAPKVRRDGWPACIPTTALVLALPFLLSDYPPVGLGRDSAPPPTLLRDRLYLDLLSNRAARDELWGWQWSLLVEQCIRRPAEPALNQWSLHAYGPLAFVREAERHGRLSERQLARVRRIAFIRVETRPYWPAGGDLFVRINVKRWNASGWTRCRFVPRTKGAPAFEHLQPATEWADPFSELTWKDGLIRLPPLPAGLFSPEYDVEIDGGPTPSGPWTHLGTHPLVIPVSTAPPGVDLVTPVSCPALDDLLREGLDVSVRIEEGRAYLDLRRPAWSGPWDDPSPPRYLPAHEYWEIQLASVLANAGSLTLAMRIELLYAGEVRYAGEAWWAPLPAAYGEASLRPAIQRVLLRPTRPVAAENPDGPWELRFRSDPLIALRNFSAQRCWEGLVVRPVRPDR